MNKLAIVGSGTLTREYAPFDDLSFDIWVFNEAPMYPWCKRYDASFQLHKPEIYAGENVKVANYWDWLQKETKPVYMSELDERVPGCEVYPLKDALGLGYKQFGMSCAYALALGILKGYERIEVWGIELSATEYQYGMDTWSYWVGFAKGKLGNNFVLHCGEKLFDAPLYGIEGGTEFEKDYFAKRVIYLDNGWKSKDKVLQNYKKLFEKYISNNEFDKTINLFVDFEKTALEAGEYAGALEEAEKWNKDIVISRNEFELAAATAQRDGDDKRSLMLHNGGIIDYVCAIWKQSNGDKNAAKQLMSLLDRHLVLAYDTGAYHGKFIENQSYIMKYDDLVLANGGRIKEVTNQAKAVFNAYK